MGLPASDVYYHPTERERVHLLLFQDVKRRVTNVEATCEVAADAAIARIQHRRAVGATGKTEQSTPKRG